MNLDCLNTLQRTETRRTLGKDVFDLVVVGGGITGAGIALDAASRGLRVALLERSDYASGTSSRSTRLIHGGLRYLKQFEFGLVRESGRERELLHRLAPNLIRKEKMLLPVVKGGSYSRFTLRIGLWLYDWLAGVARNDRKKMLNAEEALKVEPLLRSDILRGAGLYTEYITDDARLVLALVKTAVQHGALCLNYMEVKRIRRLENQSPLYELHAVDRFHGTDCSVRAKSVVNAAGPWVHLVDDRMAKERMQGREIVHSKGVHLVVKHTWFPVCNPVYFDAGDGRMIFAIPERGCTYIGTTDTLYTGSPDHLKAEGDEMEYLLRAANAMFPGIKLTDGDVSFAWVGIRPLVKRRGRSGSTKDMSRRDEIFESPDGVITIAGGKLTGYRRMAERVTDKVLKQQGREAPCRTASIRLDDAWPDFQLPLHELMRFCIREEGVARLEDFFSRRTGWIKFETERFPEIETQALEILATEFKWTPERKEQEKWRWKESNRIWRW